MIDEFDPPWRVSDKEGTFYQQLVRFESPNTKGVDIIASKMTTIMTDCDNKSNRTEQQEVNYGLWIKLKHTPWQVLEECFGLAQWSKVSSASFSANYKKC